MDLSSVFSLDNKVALITGASKGIGLAIAEIFAAAGAKVVISSRKQEALDDMANHLKSRGYEATGIACNVGNMEELPQLVEKTVEKYGQIDILVNNAASNPAFGPVHETSLEAFDKIMDVNVKAPFELTRLCFPHLRKSSNASVINISSIGGISPEHGLGIYSVSKAALISLTKVYAKEWGDAKIRVNAICPGLIQTKFSEALWSNDKIMSMVMKQLAIKRAGTSEEIGAMALFLASSASSYTTGGVFTADGGFTI
ncbi:NAD(P)-dependent dehydrogenase, short-chain alcohol dehydrogenase family [Algoriphagus ornithinivorans]|uniref:NAD(P)-dependent dehydrogenase, short-chain alcohol dehydrogenase family n=1 Tax=Algoriphagus ornithinivorans TaxID=226506 RepID=A0A1I5GYB6_9BACT|nr:glucose 1-dehydrogenase [Algoriphagus ornithinivorans]SFO40992.1 NAD(P)-dependent dehydrogenase, short-chain alcohol dehydrogenase family [Algoriphagus ornithinivorans]